MSVYREIMEINYFGAILLTKGNLILTRNDI